MKGKVLAKGLVLVICLFMLSIPSAMAQEPCTADFNCNGTVAAEDVDVFLNQFGRTPFNNPCPDCYDSPCPCTAPAPVTKTGQTTCYDSTGSVISCTGTGQDGEYQKGVVWPNPRFTDNGDGTVTDNLTGLIWLKNANCFGTINWDNALSVSNGLADAACGLTDGSVAGDWRLSNKRELFSLVHDEYYYPALPNTAGTGQWSAGDPFTDVQSDFYYWSSTTYAPSTPNAWAVSMYDVYVIYAHKTSTSLYVWPVRGGQ